MIRRREFISLIGGAAAWPVGARAQQSGPMRRVGVLMNTAEADPDHKVYWAAFLQGLRSLGWIDGQNLHIELRWNLGDPERARTAATELLRLSPDVILSSSSANLNALLRQGPAMPVVFIQVSDPIAQGFVSNLTHPGGNITGFSNFEFSIVGKWLDLLKQIAPNLAHVAIIFNPDISPQSRFFLNSIETVAPSLGMETIAVAIHDTPDIERAIETESRRPNSGLIVPPDAFMRVNAKSIVELAARFRLPAIYPGRAFTAVGGLMSYGGDNASQFRQAAIYIDRILSRVASRATCRFRLRPNSISS
jgi:putative ABC transport system substrate-binding protein